MWAPQMNIVHFQRGIPISQQNAGFIITNFTQTYEYRFQHDLPVIGLNSITCGDHLLTGSRFFYQALVILHPFATVAYYPLVTEGDNLPLCLLSLQRLQGAMI